MSALSTPEHVLVIPATQFEAAGAFTGFRSFTSEYQYALLDLAHFQFRPRSEVESDPSWKQLIPYVVLRHGDALFHYTRGGAGTETRLRALRSVGIGGHINPEDGDGSTDPYRAGMVRELTEEVDIRAGYREHALGFIYDPSTLVGSVHLGVVHLFELDAPEVTPREPHLEATGFTPLSVLRASRSDFETWSQLVFDALPS